MDVTGWRADLKPLPVFLNPYPLGRERGAKRVPARRVRLSPRDFFAERTPRKRFTFRDVYRHRDASTFPPRSRKLARRAQNSVVLHLRD